MLNVTAIALDVAAISKYHRRIGFFTLKLDRKLFSKLYELKTERRLNLKYLSLSIEAGDISTRVLTDTQTHTHSTVTFMCQGLITTVCYITQALHITNCHNNYWFEAVHDTLMVDLMILASFVSL